MNIAQKTRWQYVGKPTEQFGHIYTVTMVAPYEVHAWSDPVAGEKDGIGGYSWSGSIQDFLGQFKSMEQAK